MKYEYLMRMSSLCKLKAAAYFYDENLKRFYLNAAEGFKQKALNLVVGEE